MMKTSFITPPGQQFGPPINTLRPWENEQYSSTGSDNGLAPTRRQAIIWTNGG